MMETGHQKDIINQSNKPIPLLGVELKETTCGQFRSAELKCEIIRYCQLIAKLLPSTS